MKRLSLLLVSLLAVVACAPDITPSVAPVTPVVITPTVTVTPVAVAVAPTPRPAPLPPSAVAAKPTPARTASPKLSPTPTTSPTTITPRPSPTPSPTPLKVAFIKASIANYGEMKYPGTANIDIPVGVLVTISLHDADAQALRLTNVPMSIEVTIYEDTGLPPWGDARRVLYQKVFTATSTEGLPPVHVIRMPFFPSGGFKGVEGLANVEAIVTVKIQGLSLSAKTKNRMRIMSL